MEVEVCIITEVRLLWSRALPVLERLIFIVTSAIINGVFERDATQPRVTSPLSVNAIQVMTTWL